MREKVVSYRNSTSNHNSEVTINSRPVVVSYRNSTSNHNLVPYYCNIGLLYLIEILHQTTTLLLPALPVARCILSKFYIKPQPKTAASTATTVVSYRNSTSNHNKSMPRNFRGLVVSYRNSTSNHNYSKFMANVSAVVSYRNSTSNHNAVYG